MVAPNPLTATRWTAKHFKATVINDIWAEITFFTLVATMVSLVSAKTTHSLGISNQMLTVLGTVLGLVVSFRTSSAYDRYWEGRKLWTSISLASRNIASMVWVHVPIDRAADATGPSITGIEDETSEQTRIKAIIEKKTMINLVQAFSVSVKHMLRGEDGIYYEDLYPLVCFLPRYSTTSDPTDEDLLPLWDESAKHMPEETQRAPFSERPHGYPTPQRASSVPTGHGEHDEAEKPGAQPRHVYSADWPPPAKRAVRQGTFNPERLLPTVHSDRPLAPARNPPRTTLYDYLPFLRLLAPLVSLFKPVLARWHNRRSPALPAAEAEARSVGPDILQSNVPLEITLFLSSYLGWLLKKGLLAPAIATALTNNIGALQDTMANLDRVRSTPIPFAYQAHLRMTMWLYLFFLPFQIYNAFQYLTIPATTFAAFLLLGFLEIGHEIENPFNYDLNDLDLDHFCLKIQRDLHEITAHPAPAPESYVFGPWNHPFAPADRRSAEDILRGRGGPAHAYAGDAEDGMARVRRTLLASWRAVEVGTVDRQRFRR